MSMWRASVLTIFPEMFPGPLAQSLAGKALTFGIWSLDAVDIRAHANDKHRTVDDTPAGGGPGKLDPGIVVDVSTLPLLGERKSTSWISMIRSDPGSQDTGSLTCVRNLPPAAEVNSCFNC